jgi:hypothetical protein
MCKRGDIADKLRCAADALLDHNSKGSGDLGAFQRRSSLA